MSSILNPYAVDILGNAAPLAPIPQLRAEGLPMSRAQLDMAKHVFLRFTDRARVSFAPNNNEQGFLPDGSRYRITDNTGMRIMQVWPITSGGEKITFQMESGIVVSRYGIRFYVLRFRDGVWGWEQSMRGCCALSVVHRETPSGSMVHFVKNRGAGRAASTWYSPTEYFDGYAGVGKRDDDLDVMAWKSKLFNARRAYEYYGENSDANLSRSAGRVLFLETTRIGEDVTATIYAEKFPAEVATWRESIEPKTPNREIAVGAYKLNGETPNEEVGLSKDGSFILTSTSVVNDGTPTNHYSWTTGLTKAVEYYSVNKEPKFRIDMRPVSYYVWASNWTVRKLSIGTEKGPRDIPNVDVAYVKFKDRLTTKQKKNVRYRKLIDMIDFMTTVTYKYTRREEIVAGTLYPPNPAEVSFFKTYPRANCTFDEYNMYIESGEDCTLLSRNMDASGRCYDIYLHTKLTVENGFDFNGYDQLEDVKHPIPIPDERTNNTRISHSDDPDQRQIEGYSYEVTSDPEPDEEPKLPYEERKITQASTKVKSVLKFVRRGSPLDDIDLKSIIEMEDGIVIQESEIKVSRDNSRIYEIPELAMESKLVTREQLGFHHDSGIGCFLEIEAEYVDFEHVKLMINAEEYYTDYGLIKGLFDVDVRFVVYKGNDKIYSKELESKIRGSKIFEIRLWQDPYNDSIANERVPEGISKTDFYMGVKTSTGCITTARWDEKSFGNIEPGWPWASYGVKQMTYEPYNHTYKDPNCYARIHLWDFEADGFPGISPNAVLFKQTASPAGLIGRPERFDTSVGFGIDSNSGGVAVICKHAQILISPDGKIQDLASVQNKDGELFPMEGLDQWCAST